MKGFTKFLALGAVVAASSSFALADTINTTGFGTVGASSISFLNNKEAFTNNDSGVFAGLDGDDVYYYGPLAYSSNTAMEVFSVGTTFAKAQTAAGSLASYTSTSTSLGACTPDCMSIDSVGFITLAGDATPIYGTLVLTTQDNSNDSQVSFSATATSVTPEPNSLILMGTGLIGAAGLLFMRRRNANGIA